MLETSFNGKIECFKILINIKMNLYFPIFTMPFISPVTKEVQKIAKTRTLHTEAYGNICIYRWLYRQNQFQP